MGMTKKQAAALGGNAVVQKYGPEYMRQLGRKGAESFHKRYKLVPYGTDDWAIVHRDTNLPTGRTINGQYIRKDEDHGTVD